MRIKWKSLRDNYVRYKKEMENSTNPNSKRYKRCQWTTRMQFLDKTLALRESTSNISSSTSDKQVLQKPPLKKKKPSPEEILPSTSSAPTFGIQLLDVLPSEPMPNQVSSKINKCNHRSNRVDKILDYLQNKSTQNYDSVDHLFLSYAETFKKFSERNQVELKLQLAKLFADAELIEIEERSQSSTQVVYQPNSVNSDNSDNSINDYSYMVDSD